MTTLGLNTEGIHSDPVLATRLQNTFGFNELRVGLHAFEDGRNRRILEGLASMPFVDWTLVVHGGFFTKLGNDIPLDFREAQDAFDSSWRQIKRHLDDMSFLQHSWSIECGNEPSLAPKKSVFRDPRVAAAYFNYCQGRVRNDGYQQIELLTPAPHNLDRTVGYQYLRTMMAHIERWDHKCTVALHRYVPSRHGGPHVGWKTRAHEQNALDALLQGREYSVTETGISALRRPRRGFPLCFTRGREFLTETEQGTIIMSELRYWKDKAKKVFLYQLNSCNVPDDSECYYGIRDHEHQWKGYAYLLKGAME